MSATEIEDQIVDKINVKIKWFEFEMFQKTLLQILREFPLSKCSELVFTIGFCKKGFYFQIRNFFFLLFFLSNFRCLKISLMILNLPKLKFK